MIWLFFFTTILTVKTEVLCSVRDGHEIWIFYIDPNNQTKKEKKIGKSKWIQLRDVAVELKPLLVLIVTNTPNKSEYEK